MAPVLALTFLVGGVLLASGVPLAGEAVTKIPGDPVLRRIQNHEFVSRDRLELLIGTREDALFWNESPDTWSELGLAQLLLAASAETEDQEKRDFIIAAIASLRKSLSLAPADAFVWTRLAYAQMLLSGPSPEAARSLRVALLTAPYEPRLFAVRVEVAFWIWSYVDARDRDLVFQQVRWIWRDGPKRLIELARSTDRIAVVRRALSADPDELLRFEVLLKKQAS